LISLTLKIYKLDNNNNNKTLIHSFNHINDMDCIDFTDLWIPTKLDYFEITGRAAKTLIYDKTSKKYNVYQNDDDKKENKIIYAGYNFSLALAILVD
jgi:hypothetical protein